MKNDIKIKKIIKKLNNRLRKSSNMEDVQCGNRMDLTITYGSDVIDMIFELEKLANEK